MRRRTPVAFALAVAASLAGAPAAAGIGEGEEMTVGGTIAPALVVVPAAALGWSLSATAEATLGVHMLRLGLTYASISTTTGGAREDRDVVAPLLGYRYTMDGDLAWRPWLGGGAGVARTEGEVTAAAWGPMAYGELGVTWIFDGAKRGSSRGRGISFGVRVVVSADEVIVDLPLTLYGGNRR